MKHLYNIILIVGTTWLVGWCGWSKWTFVFMIFLILLATETVRIERSYK